MEIEHGADIESSLPRTNLERVDAVSCSVPMYLLSSEEGYVEI